MTRTLLRALAAWRLTELATTDEITRPAREWAGKRGGRIAYLAACPRCLSVWAGLAVILIPEWMSTALGVSAATILLTDWREQQAAEAVQARMAAARGGSVRTSETS
jgi:hypothetical protein